MKTTSEQLAFSARQSARYWEKHGTKVHSVLVDAWDLEAGRIERGESHDYDEQALLKAYAVVERKTRTQKTA